MLNNEVIRSEVPHLPGWSNNHRAHKNFGYRSLRSSVKAANRYGIVLQSYFLHEMHGTIHKNTAYNKTRKQKQMRHGHNMPIHKHPRQTGEPTSPHEQGLVQPNVKRFTAHKLIATTFTDKGNSRASLRCAENLFKTVKHPQNLYAKSRDC